VKDWVTLIYFKLKATSWKTDLDDFVDEFDSRHVKRRNNLRWGDDDIKFEHSLCRNLCETENYSANCLNLFCFAYDKTVINQRRGWNVRVWGSVRENSVWIMNWTTLLGIFCKINFTPAVKSCYQVYALNDDAYLSAALLCYLGATGAETSMLLTAHWID